MRTTNKWSKRCLFLKRENRLKGDSYKLFISVHEIMSRKDHIDEVQRAEITKRHK